MTHAAPPEKMTLADALNQIESAVVNFQLSHKEAMKEVLAGVSAARRLAPRVGDCSCASFECLNAGASNCRRLSAPPAASADERDDLLQFIYGWVQPEMTVPITDALIKAGYRKRAAGGEG